MASDLRVKAAGGLCKNKKNKKTKKEENVLKSGCQCVLFKAEFHCALRGCFIQECSLRCSAMNWCSPSCCSHVPHPYGTARGCPIAWGGRKGDGCRDSVVPGPSAVLPSPAAWRHRAHCSTNNLRCCFSRVFPAVRSGHKNKRCVFPVPWCRSRAVCVRAARSARIAEPGSSSWGPS